MAKRQYRLTLDNLRVLDAIDRHGSFALAAQELCVVTSSVTHAIHNIEENLSLTIFDRSGRRARFTRDGRVLLEKGRHLLARAAEFDEEVQVLATGWEPDFVLTLDPVIRMEALMVLAAEFCREAPQTSLHVKLEAVNGCWDALLSRRADLIVGAPGEGPAGGGYETVAMHKFRFVFAVAPAHPLAQRKGLIPNAEIAMHRSIIAADTTRDLPQLPRGLLDSRNVLSVPTTEAKLLAILQGAGCGFLSTRLAQPHIKAGRLVSLKTEVPQPPNQGHLAWRAGEKGRALSWWIKRLSASGAADKLYY